jgi:hypothetical protein
MKKLVLAALAGWPVAFPARAADETRGRPDWIGRFDPGPLTNGVSIARPTGGSNRRCRIRPTRERTR